MMKKQKLPNQEEVCDEQNFEQLPEQEPELFVWSNQQGGRMEWTTNRTSSNSNALTEDLPRIYLILVVQLE